MKNAREGRAEEGIVKERTGNINQQRMLFLMCPNVSFAVVVFQAAWKEDPQG